MKTVTEYVATLTPEARADIAARSWSREACEALYQATGLFTSEDRERAESAVDNLRRAERAADILTAHCHRCGSEPSTVLTDLLADLMHWAAANGQDFQTALDNAREYHNAES